MSGFHSIVSANEIAEIGQMAIQAGMSAYPTHSVHSGAEISTRPGLSRIAFTGQMATQSPHALQWDSTLHAMTKSPSRAEKTLAEIPMFSSLDEGERAALAELAVERRYDAGTVIFAEGEPCEGIYLIGEGIVKIVKTTATGREIMLTLEAAPSTVAEVPIFDGGPYPATVIAVRDTVAYLISRNDFFRVCRTNHEIPMKMLRVMGKRLRQLVMLLQAVTFGSVRQRLARQLLEWLDEARGGEFALPLSHEELAMRLGTVREVISRNLSRFQAEGLLIIERRRIRILDPEGLRNEAESEL